MKADERYSYILVCPTTQKQLSQREHHYSRGVCPHCGNVFGAGFTHAQTIAGRWVRPTFLDWLCGKRALFVEKTQ